MEDEVDDVEERAEGDLVDADVRHPSHIYDEFAKAAGEADYESFWERRFEGGASAQGYRQAAFELGRELREWDSGPEIWLAENLVREAYMRRGIERAIEAGTDPGKIVAVVGAYHAPVLHGDEPAMTDAE